MVRHTLSVLKASHIGFGTEVLAGVWGENAFVLVEESTNIIYLLDIYKDSKRCLTASFKF